MIPTCFSKLIGNEFIKNCLIRLVKKKAIGHSLLFAGPSGIGKSLFASVIAASSMSEDEKERAGHCRKISQGIHPDVHIYRPEGKIGLHSIQSLRKMCDEIQLPPYEAPSKVFIVHDAHRMLSFSANALLKTFEEPPPQTKIILLTHSHTTLLPTILSRCSTYFFHPISENEIFNYLSEHYQSEPEQLRAWAHLSQGSLGQALKLAKRGGDPTRALVLDALSTGSLQSYKNLVRLSDVLTEEIEARKKTLEDEIKELQIKSSEYLSLGQHAVLEKDLEGASAIELMEEANILFYNILSWYRDLSLMQAGGGRCYLINQDYEDALESSLQFGQILPLAVVQKAIEEAQFALKRSTSLNICLENLFLKLMKF